MELTRRLLQNAILLLFTQQATCPTFFELFLCFVTTVHIIPQIDSQMLFAVYETLLVDFPF